MKLLNLCLFLLISSYYSMTAQPADTIQVWFDEIRDSLDNTFEEDYFRELDSTGQLPILPVISLDCAGTLLITNKGLNAIGIDTNQYSTDGYHIRAYLYHTYGDFWNYKIGWEELHQYQIPTREGYQPYYQCRIGTYCLILLAKQENSTHPPAYIHYFKAIDQSPPIFSLDKASFNQYYFDEDTVDRPFHFRNISFLDQFANNTHCEDADSAKVRRSINPSYLTQLVHTKYNLNGDQKIDSLDGFSFENNIWFTPWSDSIDLFRADFESSFLLEVYIKDNNEQLSRSIQQRYNWINYGIDNFTISTFEFQLRHGGELVPGLLTPAICV